VKLLASITKQQSIKIVSLSAVIVSLILVGIQLYSDGKMATVDQ